MATPYTDAYVRYDGNGVTTEFSIDFDYKAESEIKVYLKRGSEEQITVPSSDYSFVTKNTLKFPASGSSETVLDVGDILAIQRESEFVSEYVFDNQRRLEPVEVMNSDDNLERQIQELKRDVGQSIRIQPTSKIDTDEYFKAVESVYENIDDIKIVSGISGEVIVCAENIEAIKDAPNQASAAAQSALEASQSADESRTSASEAKSSADNAQESLTELKTTATDAFNENAAQKQAAVDASAEESRKWAVGTIQERPEGSAEYWANSINPSQFAKKDLSNVPAEYDYVVDSYSGDDGWYRVYKSGWVEQGGVTDIAENQLVTFLKPLLGLPNAVSAFALSKSSNNVIVYATTLDVTSTSMVVASGGWKESGILESVSGKAQKVWFVAGQGATE